MAKKAATLKNLKVRVNKDGTLSKKSLEDVQGLVKPSVGERMLGVFAPIDPLEAVGFAGLVALNYYGVDVLGRFLAEIGVKLGEAVDTAKEGASLIGEALFAVGAFGSGDPTVFGNAGITAKGMPKAVVEGVAEEVAGPMEKERMAIAMTLTALGAAAADERFQHLRDRLKELSEPSPERQRKIADAINQKLLLKKIAIATGMAYVEKKFLESYNYFKAIENIPLIQ